MNAETGEFVPNDPCTKLGLSGQIMVVFDDQKPHYFEPCTVKPFNFAAQNFAFFIGCRLWLPFTLMIKKQTLNSLGERTCYKGFTVFSSKKHDWEM